MSQNEGATAKTEAEESPGTDETQIDPGVLCMRLTLSLLPMDKEGAWIEADNLPGVVLPLAISREVLEDAAASTKLVKHLGDVLEVELIGLPERGERDYLAEAITQALARWCQGPVTEGADPGHPGEGPEDTRPGGATPRRGQPAEGLDTEKADELLCDSCTRAAADCGYLEAMTRDHCDGQTAEGQIAKPATESDDVVNKVLDVEAECSYRKRKGHCWDDTAKELGIPTGHTTGKAEGQDAERTKVPSIGSKAGGGCIEP